ncbi:hypothetical protein BJX66DRAFT_114622 [Aspergillus keveii]|uniref:Uncharacterized protein n=1 Tax=Aspergillus keveii TaxID=714993 RepID=A0ABR4GFA4_9EURO
MIDGLLLRGSISATAKTPAKACQEYSVCASSRLGQDDMIGESSYGRRSSRASITRPLLPQTETNLVFHTTAALGNPLGQRRELLGNSFGRAVSLSCTTEHPSPAPRAQECKNGCCGQGKIATATTTVAYNHVDVNIGWFSELRTRQNVRSALRCSLNSISGVTDSAHCSPPSPCLSNVTQDEVTGSKCTKLCQAVRQELFQISQRTS